MRLPRMTTRRLMIAVAVVGVVLGVIVVSRPTVQFVIVITFGPLIGACWEWIRSQDRLTGATDTDASELFIGPNLRYRCHE